MPVPFSDRVIENRSPWFSFAEFSGRWIVKMHYLNRKARYNCDCSRNDLFCGKCCRMRNNKKINNNTHARNMGSCL